jgi:predicted esterase
VATPDTAPTPWGPNNPPQAIGGDRPVTPVLPDAYDPEVAWPLVIVLHGYTASGGVQDLYFGTSERGRERGFITLAPNGLVDSKGNRYWNGSPACCDFDLSGVDDVGYILGLIDEAAALWHIDTARVYLIGHSNGAYMAHRLACDAPERVTAIGALAGVSLATLAGCKAGPPVSVLQMHGTLDASVLYAGSAFYPGAADHGRPPRRGQPLRHRAPRRVRARLRRQRAGRRDGPHALGRLRRRQHRRAVDHERHRAPARLQRHLARRGPGLALGAAPHAVTTRERTAVGLWRIVGPAVRALLLMATLGTLAAALARWAWPLELAVHFRWQMLVVMGLCALAAGLARRARPAALALVVAGVNAGAGMVLGRAAAARAGG